MAHSAQRKTIASSNVEIRSGGVILQGELSIPEGAPGVVLFAHGSGSSCHTEEVARLAADWFQKHLRSESAKRKE